ncbi:MAG: malate synthase, partial [Firmicutes bacterium]|nr:malate synthase [Bacillota bacterium]
WENVIQGQVNLTDATQRSISFTNPDGKRYTLNEQTATLIVRPRGWHLVDKHVLIGGQPVSASLLDFGLYFFHNARRLIARGTGPYFYLPKLESHREARLWNDVFNYAQDALVLPRGTIKATVLIETILAAFEMEEILYELREHSAGLNAGRWDYIFSLIKKFRNQPEFVLPDRSQITMPVSFMRSYCDLLVRTCHRRGAHAIGGMAAFIPCRRDPRVNEAALANVRNDKRREARQGFDGSRVAHPDLVPVATAVFDELLGEQPNQLDRLRADVNVTAGALLGTQIRGGKITEAGLRGNISVTIQYLESWLRGTGAVVIDHLMEDAATAEIARSQLWQWLRHGARLANDGPRISQPLIRLLVAEELAQIRAAVGDEAYASGRFADATALFEQVVLGERFYDFLTVAAYAYLY